MTNPVDSVPKKELRTSYTVDMCEAPDCCDFPECFCERLFTHQYVKKMYDELDHKSKHIKWLEEEVERLSKEKASLEGKFNGQRIKLLLGVYPY